MSANKSAVVPRSKFAREAMEAAAANPLPSENAVALFQPAAGMMAKAKRLNLPRLVNIADEFPIGSALVGEVVKIVDNFTGKPEMKGSKVLWMRHESGAEFLFPLTGVVRKALEPDPEKFIGKTISIVRNPDGFSGKYKKAMFQFDVFEV